VRLNTLRGGKKFTIPEPHVARVRVTAPIRLKIVLGDSEKQDHHSKIRQLTEGERAIIMSVRSRSNLIKVGYGERQSF
jgi:hypothetical protein